MAIDTPITLLVANEIVVQMTQGSLVAWEPISLNVVLNGLNDEEVQKASVYFPVCFFSVTELSKLILYGLFFTAHIVACRSMESTGITDNIKILHSLQH